MKAGALTEKERPIIKALIGQGKRLQDIQHLINTGRKATINTARVFEVKANDSITPAPSEEVEHFILCKKSYDPYTGLNKFDDERLVRAREAMLLAVQSFNNPLLKFKTGQFLVQAVIAWTYLFHEYYVRRKTKICTNGHYISLSRMIERNDIPITEGIKNNIKSIIKIRNKVSHGHLIGIGEQNKFPILQSCCINFNKVLCAEFGVQVSLENELFLALQFSKLSLEQATITHSYGIPKNICDLNKWLSKNFTDDQQNDLEYQSSILVTLAQTSERETHIEFVKPDSAKGGQIYNVLERRVIADNDYPHKPKKAAELIANKSDKIFTVNNHTRAWKKHGARPSSKSSTKENTKKDWCIYHKAHDDYTYSQKWIEFICEKISTDEGYNEIKNFK